MEIQVLGRINPPVREVEVNPAKEWDKEEGEDEEGDVARTGGHFLVVKVGKTTSGIAMQNDCLPRCVLNHSQQGVEHVVDHLLITQETANNRMDVLFDKPLQVQCGVAG